MSKIKLSFDGNDYVLEYSRQSVKTMESQGFVADKITEMPMTMIPKLFEGAFIKNHTGVKRKIMDDIYDDVADKTGLIQALIEMYGDTLRTLTDDNAKGNATWAMVK